jgi:cellulose biosynthesis protein BcsQ
VAKIITFFNHKGGVGKTTLAYNVAWGLSSVDKRVLMLDCDAQCNLTEVTIDDDEKILESFEARSNVYEFFNQYIRPKPGQRLTEPEFFVKNDNLKLLPGSLSLAELDSSISMSFAGISAMSDIPENMYNALSKLGANFDYILIDLSPALSATNQLFVMLSDYFIIPVNTSIFSKQALKNLGIIFRMWNKEISTSSLFMKSLKALPKLLGIVCQNYRPFTRKKEQDTRSARRFGEMMNELNKRTISLASDLNGFGMAVTPSEFKEIFVESDPYRIADIPDYNQLGVISEGANIPVYGLDDKILNAHGINIEHYREQVENCQRECRKIVDGLLKLL